MELDQIIDQLSRDDGFPREALSAAASRREEVTPVFLQVLDDFVAGGAEDIQRSNLVFFVLHLLAEFRERRAFALLIDLMRLDPPLVDLVLGEASTETLPGLVISLYDGDTPRLKAAMEDTKVDEFIRCSLFEAFGYLAFHGEIDREEAAHYLRDCYRDLRPQAENFVWVGWQAAIAILGLSELVSLVERVFRRGFIGPHYMKLSHFKADLQVALTNPVPTELFEAENLGPLDDTIGALADWDWSRHSDSSPVEPNFDDFAGFGPSEPRFNPWRGVGRNDPCPCGSGKKFKKCCLDAVQASSYPDG